MAAGLVVLQLPERLSAQAALISWSLSVRPARMLAPDWSVDGLFLLRPESAIALTKWSASA
jgi:hypothetical protein